MRRNAVRGVGVALVVLFSGLSLAAGQAEGAELNPLQCISQRIAAGCVHVEVGNITDVATSPDGGQVLAAGGDFLSIFSRAPDTGLLSYVGCVAGPRISTCQSGGRKFGAGLNEVIFSPDGQNVYVGGNAGLFTLDRDPATGELTVHRRAADESAFADDLIISDDGEFVYGAGQTFGVSWYKRRPGGSLAYKGCLAAPKTRRDCNQLPRRARNVSDVAIEPAGRAGYVSARGVGGESFTITRVLRKRTTGELRPRECYDSARKSGCEGGRRLRSLLRVGDLAIPHDSNTLYTASLPQFPPGVINVFERRRRGRLALRQCIANENAPPAIGRRCESLGPRSPFSYTGEIVPSGDGRALYATGHQAVLAFDRNRRTGLLSFGDCVEQSGLDGGCDTEFQGLGQLRAVAISPDDESVYSGGWFKSMAVDTFARG